MINTFNSHILASFIDGPTYIEIDMRQVTAVAKVGEKARIYFGSTWYSVDDDYVEVIRFWRDCHA